jgi:hypothetical protein
LRFNRLLCAGLMMFPLFATLQAQSTTLPPRRIGFTAGVNSSTISSDDGEPSRLTGVVAGVLIVFPMTPAFSIQPELLYSMKGVQTKGQGLTVTGRLTYLEMPILARYDIPTTGRAKPFVYGGPAVAVNLSCKAKVSGGGQSFSGDCEDPNTGDGGVKMVDVSAVIGGGLAFDVGGRTFTIGARYVHGLVNVDESTDPSDAKNRTISVLASLEFPWPKR